MDVPEDEDNLDFYDSNELLTPQNRQSTEKITPWQDVEPIFVTKEEFTDIFGNSSDEEDEFYGFSDRDLGLKEFRSVMSPNKLKLQNDFYMPLFLSHRRRNRDIVLEKAHKLEKGTRKSLDALTSDRKCEVGKTKKPAKDVTKKLQEDFHRVDMDNPYAKTYKSYRKDRSRSFPLPVPQSQSNLENEDKRDSKAETACLSANDDEKDLNEQGNEAVEVGKKGSAEVQDPSGKHASLKMKIHYKSHVRPKRKVIVQERDDFVYGITLPSKRRARTLSPTVITSAKILKDDPAAEHASPAKEAAVRKANKKRRKKHSSSSTVVSDASEDLPRDVPRDVMVARNLFAEKETVFAPDMKAKQSLFNEKTSIEEREATIKRVQMHDSDTGMSDESNAEKTLKVEQEFEVEVSSDVSKTKSTELRPKRKKRFKNFRDPNEGYSRAILSDIFNDVAPEDSTSESKCSLPDGAAKSESAVTEPEDMQAEVAMKSSPETSREKPVDSSSACVDVPSTILQENEKTKRGIGSSDRRAKKHQSHIDAGNASMKPRDFNLTDSWFIVNPAPSKRRGKPSSNKHVESVSDPAEREAGQQSPSVGKFVSADRKMSAPKKRRLKNVTYASPLDLSADDGNAPAKVQDASADKQHNPDAFDETCDHKEPPSHSHMGNENYSSTSTDCGNGDSSKPCSQRKLKEGREKSFDEKAKGRGSNVEISIDSSEEKKWMDYVPIDCGGESAKGQSGKALKKNKAQSKGLRNSLASRAMKKRGQSKEEQAGIDEASKDIEHHIDAKIGDHARSNVAKPSHVAKSCSAENAKAKRDEDSTRKLGNASHRGSFDTSLGAKVLESRETKAVTVLEQVDSKPDGDGCTPEITFAKPLAMIEGKKFECPYLSTDEEGETATRESETSASQKDDGSTGVSDEAVCGGSADGPDEESMGDRKVNRRFPRAVDDPTKVKSGKSFIIKTPVDGSKKQVSVTSEKVFKRRDSQGSVNDNSDDAEIDLVASDAKDDDDFKDSKVKRKVYTVVRKIRRTEINAEGKKVTKIIRQVVKKVCPVNTDPFGKTGVGLAEESSGAKDQRVVSGEGADTRVRTSKGKGEKVSSVCDDDEKASKAKGDRKSLANKALRCGKCAACTRKADCHECDNCRKKLASFPKKLSIVCKMKQCHEKRKIASDGKLNADSTQDATRAVKNKAGVVHERKEMTVKSLSSKKNSGSKKGSQSSLTTPEKTTAEKPRPKSKGSRAKNVDVGDIVYSPGFKLRSQRGTEIKAKPNRILKEVQYSGMQPTVKLPWPDEQDEQSVCNSGNFFCVTTPITITTKDICFHCGSGGFQKMVTCISCSEAYHEFCIEIDPLDENQWFCDRCKRCNVCGYKDNLLMCDKCHDCYHAECLGPNYHKQTEGVDDLWVCAKCVKCEKCGTKIPGKRKESKWMRNFTLCEECDRRMRRGQFCSICENVYSENDYDTKMMYCSNCGKWVHMECEGLNADEYECLAELPEEVPYICKLCHDSDIWSRWYQEVREEMQAGFEKIYYELVASSDYKIVSKHLPGFNDSDAKKTLERVFEMVQRHEIPTVADFKKAIVEFIEKLKELVIGVLPDQIIFDLEVLLKKQLKSMFSWTNGEDSKTDQAKTQQRTVAIGGIRVPNSAIKAIDLDHAYHSAKDHDEVEQTGTSDKENVKEAPEEDPVNLDSNASALCKDDNIFERLICREKSVSEVQDIMQDIASGATNVTTDRKMDDSSQLEEKAGTVLRTDPVYDASSDVTSSKTESPDPDLAGSSQNGVSVDDDNGQDVDAESLQGRIRTAKHNDDRRCQLCNQYGDDVEKDAGRILYAGNNEWVHVNCALWSAEVYENESGLLQNVHNAITRGQQLRCSTCRQWGATVGCCATSCQSNYHFMCGRNSSVIFQDNKLVYCEKHRSKSKSEVLLDGEGFVVARPVMVDLSKVSTLKKYNVDHDPDAINLYSGSLIVQRLGRLTEASNAEDALFPIGFRTTRLFWSTKDTRKRCKYFCTIEEVPIVTKPIEEDEKKDQCMRGWTICHVSKPVKRKERDCESVDRSSAKKKQKSENCEPSNGTSHIGTPVNSAHSSSYVGRPLKIGKSPLPPTGAKHTSLSSIPCTASSHILPMPHPVTFSSIPSIPGIVSKTPRRTIYTKASPQKSAPHKIIPQPSSQFSPFDVHDKNSHPVENVVRPRLIQPKLRYELVPTILQPDCTGSAKQPILPKFETPVVAIAQHLHYHLNTNPNMLNYVGDTTLQGLNRVLGLTYPTAVNSVPLSVAPSSAMLPCYTLNLPEAFWQMQTVKQPFQVHRGNCVASKRRKTDAQSQARDTVEQEKGTTIGMDKAELMKRISDCVKERANNRMQESRTNSLGDSSGMLSKGNTINSDTFVHTSSRTCSDAGRHQVLSPASGHCTPAASGHTMSDVNGPGRDRKQSNSGDTKSLPAFSELVEKLSSKDQMGSTPSDRVEGDSRLSLDKVSELSCLQAAAQLAKLMPEVFIEGQSRSDTRSTSVPGPDNVVTCASSDEVVVPALNSQPTGPKSPSKACSSLRVRQKDAPSHRSRYHEQMERLLDNGKEAVKSRLRIHVKNEEGLQINGSSVQEIWRQLVDLLNETRTDQKLPTFLFNESDAFDFFGLSKFPVVFLAEQLPGGHKCRSYKFQFHLPCTVDEDKELPLNASGCARAEAVSKRPPADMFAWLASPYRTLPKYLDESDNDAEINKTASDLPLSMRFRQLKNSVKNHVGVYRSRIDGRGLFCKRQIEASEMVIEYAGSVIRATLTDKRENYYEGKGYGCYMFRIDDSFVVDATLFGNEARFINHSCEPNCYSRIVSVDGEKHIVIFASRRIFPGEELTYDYKFPFEEEKLPCHCGSRKCRKYLN